MGKLFTGGFRYDFTLQYHGRFPVSVFSTGTGIKNRQKFLIRIRTKMSRIPITGKNSFPKIYKRFVISSTFLHIFQHGGHGHSHGGGGDEGHGHSHGGGGGEGHGHSHDSGHHGHNHGGHSHSKEGGNSQIMQVSFFNFLKYGYFFWRYYFFHRCMSRIIDYLYRYLHPTIQCLEPDLETWVRMR